MTSRLRIGGYVRYCEDRERLQAAIGKMIEMLAGRCPVIPLEP